MVREALAALLGLEDDIDVVVQVARGDEVLEAARAHTPDVAVMDIEMPGLSGLDAAAVLREGLPGVKVVILTTFGRPGYLRRAMESGADAFLVKDAPAAQLADALRRVLRGERVIDPGLAAAALAEGASPLTPREQQVLRASADGSSNAEWHGCCTCRTARSATTCRPPSTRPAAATAATRCASPATRAGFDDRPSAGRAVTGTQRQDQADRGRGDGECRSRPRPRGVRDGRLGGEQHHCGRAGGRRRGPRAER